MFKTTFQKGIMNYILMQEKIPYGVYIKGLK